MKHFLTATSIAALLTSISPAAIAIPQFADYPASPTFTGKPAQIDFSNRSAAKFRTVLSAGIKKGANFAGHYALVTWGCGTACQELAIVDLKTGKATFPSSLKLNAYQAVTDGSEPFEYKLTSRLLVVAGSPNDTDKTGVLYYIWNGHDLKLIETKPKTWSR